MASGCLLQGGGAWSGGGVVRGDGGVWSGGGCLTHGGVCYAGVSAPGGWVSALDGVPGLGGAWSWWQCLVWGECIPACNGPDPSMNRKTDRHM